MIRCGTFTVDVWVIWRDRWVLVDEVSRIVGAGEWLG